MPTLSLTPVSPSLLSAPNALQWADGMVVTDSMVIDDGTGDWSVYPGILSMSAHSNGSLSLATKTPGVLP